MATQVPGVLVSFPAAADFSTTGQFRFGKVDAAGRIALAAAATDIAVGVIQDDVATIDDAASVMITGTAKVVLGGTVAPGDAVTSDATGRALTTVTAGNQVHGICKEGGAINEIGTIVLHSTQL